MDILGSIKLIKSALPERAEYQLHEPFFGIEEEQNVTECVKTGWVSYQGKFVTDFEKQLALEFGVNHAVAVSSGTVAQFIALKALGVGAGDAVVIPSLTFVATANAVSHTGATPHLVDASAENLALCPKKLDDYLSKNKVKAVIPVHILGHSADMDALSKVTEKHGVMMIEDAAEAIGAEYKGKKLGSFGKCAALSFNGNKVITTGGGGAVLTNDSELAAHIKHLTTTAKQAHPYEFIHDEIGYNFRMPNINAALGVGQLAKLPEFLRKKAAIAERYKKAFAGNQYFDFFEAPSYSKSNNWLNALILKPEYAKHKNEFLEKLHAAGLKCRPLWKPMHMLEIYKNSPRGDMSVTEDLYNRIICLPSSVGLYE
jgi:perosamine synthetase